MVWSLWRCAATVVFLASLSVPVRAAEMGCASFYGNTPVPEDRAKNLWPSGVRPTADTCKAAFIQGDIVEGDYQKFLSLYRKNHPFMEHVSLKSPGGTVDDAMEIGRLFRKYLIAVDSPWQEVVGGQSVMMSYRTGLCDGPNCHCASSCALIWFGAPERTGDIGLHRPRTDDPAFKVLSAADAASAYRRMLDEIVRYLQVMETPRPMIDAMVSTSSAEIRWVRWNDDKTASLWRAPSFAEWADAACGQFTNQETNTMIQLDIKKEHQALSQTEELLRTLLKEKDAKKFNCETALISSQRDKLPPP